MIRMKAKDFARLTQTRTPNRQRRTAALASFRELEKDFRKRVIQLAQAHGWRVAHFRTVTIKGKKGYYFATPFLADGKGFPDLVLVRGDTLLFVELKRQGEQLSHEQMMWRAALLGAGQRAWVWRPNDWDSSIVPTLTAGREK